MAGKKDWNGTLQLFIKSPNAPPLYPTWEVTGPDTYEWLYGQGYIQITGNYDVSILVTGNYGASVLVTGNYGASDRIK